MKISLSYLSEAALRSLREEISLLLTNSGKAAADLESNRTDYDTVNKEIADAEGGLAVENIKGIQDLEIKRAQRGMLAGRIERLEAQNAPALEAAKAKLQGVHDVIANALDSSWRDMVIEDARTLLPLTGVWVDSLRLACQTRKAVAASHFFLQRRYGLGRDPFSEARHIVKLLDAVLDGKDAMPWRAEKPPLNVPYRFPWER